MPKVVFHIFFPCGKRLSYTENHWKFLNLHFQFANFERNHFGFSASGSQGSGADFQGARNIYTRGRFVIGSAFI